MAVSEPGAPRPARSRFLTVVVMLLALLGGCVSSAGPPARPTEFHGPSYTLRVLGGSELDDMRPILDEAAQATGVTVKLTETGTLDGTQTVLSGQAAARYDAVWFSSNRYLALHGGATGKLGPSTKIMYSPVLLGLRASTAARLGWDHAQPSWADIAAAAGAHRFTFAMTNPAESNSGLSALVGITTALANTGSAVNAEQVEHATPQLRAFFGAQTLTADSSGWLSSAFQRRNSVAEGEQPIDGLVNYESILLSLNASGTLREPLSLIYPNNGVMTADYPLTLLSSASDDAKSAYTRLVGYLRAPTIQREIMDRTHRRPAIPDLPLTEQFGHHRFFELPFPAQLSVVNNLITAYFNTLRRPPRTVYVLDTSGSMTGPRLAGLKAALSALTGVNPSLIDQVSRFHNREQVTLLPFNTEPGQPTSFEVPEQTPEPVLSRIRDFSNGLSAGGKTAVYDSLMAAYTVLGDQAATDPVRINSIVLMTDGENNNGHDLQGFTEFFHRLPPDLASVPVFPVLFGENNAAEMQALAQLTGGRTFDAHAQSLADVFKAIRGYQ